MKKSFFVGVDGGGTKSMVRVEDEAGNVIGQVQGGPANIRTSVEEAWHSIDTALEKIIKPQALSKKENDFYVGMGLAGCESTDAYQTFLHHAHDFKKLTVVSDAHIACLGAHNGKDGAIIIAGTGVVGYQIQASQTAKISGWGFPYDDQGGGAWLGLEAIKLTLSWMDGRRPTSNVTRSLFARFQNDSAQLLAWLYQANATAFAELAPLVIQASEAGDLIAIDLLQQAANAIDVLALALERAQPNNTMPLPCAFLGGVSIFLEPYLSEELRARLVPCQSTPEVGAVMMIRNEIFSV